MIEPKNKYDYLAHIALALAMFFAFIPIILLFILIYTRGVEIKDLLIVFSPIVIMGPLVVLSNSFAAKANQTPLALLLKAERAEQAESENEE